MGFAQRQADTKGHATWRAALNDSGLAWSPDGNLCSPAAATTRNPTLELGRAENQPLKLAGVCRR